MSTRFGYVIATATPLGGRTQAGAASGYARALRAIGGEQWELSHVSDPAPLVVLVETGGSERTILDLWRKRLETAAKAPVLLVAHPGSNSLPASLEALARLRQDGLKGRILYLADPGDEAGLSAVTEAVRDVDAWRQLRQARIGVIGSPSGWLVASSPDPSVVRTTWGPHVSPVSLDQLTDAIRTAASHASGRDSVASGATDVVEPGQNDVKTAEFVFSAVQHIVEQRGLAGVALRCFDLVDELGTTGCVALSRLADSGIAAGCEGDVVSTVAMLWVKLLLDETSWMANPSSVDAATNSMVLAHCTVPRNMIDGYTLRSHFESGKGVAIQGVLAGGPVTLVRIGGKSMTELWLAEGEVRGTGNSDDLCRTQAELQLTDGGTVSDLLESPLGNHLVLVHGRHAGAAARLVGDDDRGLARPVPPRRPDRTRSRSMSPRHPGPPRRSAGVHQSIHRIARLIPSGRVATYGQIAAIEGTCTARMVGYAMASVPAGSDVPWHRVINGRGSISLSPGSDGHQLQRAMLESEGVVFDERGRVDLARFGWTGPGLKRGRPGRA